MGGEPGAAGDVTRDDASRQVPRAVLAYQRAMATKRTKEPKRTTPTEPAAAAAAPAATTAAKPATAAAAKLAAKPVRTTLTPADRERWIAERAYLRAEQRGFAPGGEVDDWLAAERELDAAAHAE